MFKFEADYKRSMNEHVAELIAVGVGMEREDRMQLIEELTDAYVAHAGKIPDADVLTALTDLTLHEELSDKDPDKMTNNEYPIMSEHQYLRRTTGRLRPKNKAGVTTMEVPLEHGQFVATDGDDYSPHRRSFHNPF